MEEEAINYGTNSAQKTLKLEKTTTFRRTCAETLATLGIMGAQSRVTNGTMVWRGLRKHHNTMVSRGLRRYRNLGIQYAGRREPLGQQMQFVPVSGHSRNKSFPMEMSPFTRIVITSLNMYIFSRESIPLGCILDCNYSFPD